MGRNKKLVGESKVSEHMDFSTETDKIMRAEAAKYGMTLKGYVEALILSNSPEEREKSDLEKKKAELELELAQVNFKLENIKIMEREKSEFERKIRHDRKYCIESFHLLYDISKRTAEKKILADPAIIAQIYGISLNITKCNDNFDLVEELPDDELIKFLDIQKIPGRAKREEEILKKVSTYEK